MDNGLVWDKHFYSDNNGVSPVLEFIQSLPVEDRQCVEESINKLIERNITAKKPLVSHVRGRFWELRAIRCTNTYRLIYFVNARRQIVFLHGFLKKTQRTPQHDLLIAQKRYENFIAQP